MIKVCNTYSLNDLPLGTKGRVIALGMLARRSIQQKRD